MDDPINFMRTKFWLFKFDVSIVLIIIVFTDIIYEQKIEMSRKNRIAAKQSFSVGSFIEEYNQSASASKRGTVFSQIHIENEPWELLENAEASKYLPQLSSSLPVAVGNANSFKSLKLFEFSEETSKCISF